MVMIKVYLFLILLAVQGCGTATNINQPKAKPASLGKLTPYRDPEGAFSMDLPEGWKAERNKIEEQWVTLISSDQQAWATSISSDNYNAARLVIFSLKETSTDAYPADLKAMILAGTGKPLFEGWVNALKEQARVEQVRDVYKTRFADKEAFRQELTYYRGDQYDPRKGYATFLLGSHIALFITLTGNDEGVGALEKILSSLQVEPAK